MASWLVEISSGRTTERLELKDLLGPWNQFIFLTEGTFNPHQGDFTNQTNNVVPMSPNSWVLHGLNIDTTSIGLSGTGEVFDSGGDFPSGRVSWRIVNALR
jgi:hypothetical protein